MCSSSEEEGGLSKVEPEIECEDGKQLKRSFREQ